MNTKTGNYAKKYKKKDNIKNACDIQIDCKHKLFV